MSALDPTQCSSCWESFPPPSATSKKALTGFLLTCQACSTPICWECFSGYMNAQAVMPVCSKRGCEQTFDEIFLLSVLPEKHRPLIRKHVRRVLLDEARARFPEVLQKIDATGSRLMYPKTVETPEYKQLRKQNYEARKTEKELTSQRDALRKQLRGDARSPLVGGGLRDRLQQLMAQLNSVQDLQMALNLQIASVSKHTYVDYLGRPISRQEHHLQTQQLTEKLGYKFDPSTRGTFTFPCGRPNCLGMLSTRWRCILCQGWRCKDCHAHYEVGPDAPPHQCKPDDVATAKMVLEDSKPCPKCGERISRVHGCDHMWCPHCKTGFCYSSGRILKNGNSNPHYQQWRREQAAKQGVAPDAVQPGDCREVARLVEEDVLLCRAFCLGFSLPEAALLYDFYRLTDPEANVLRAELPETALQEAIEKRVLGLITDKQLEESLFRDYRRRERHRHHQAILQTLRVAAEEILDRVMKASLESDGPGEIVASILSLREYINQSFQKVNQGLGYTRWPLLDSYFVYCFDKTYVKTDHPEAMELYLQDRYDHLLPYQCMVEAFELPALSDPEVQYRFIVELLTNQSQRRYRSDKLHWSSYDYQSVFPVIPPPVVAASSSSTEPVPLPFLSPASSSSSVPSSPISSPTPTPTPTPSPVELLSFLSGASTRPLPLPFLRRR